MPSHADPQDGVEQVAEWLTRLEVARRLHHFYEGDHPATAPAKRQLHDATLALPPVVSLMRITSLGFDVPGAELPISAGGTRRLARQLAQLGMVAIAIAPPVPQEDVGRFVDLMASLTDRPTEADRTRVLERASTIRGIEIVPIDVDWFVFSESLSSTLVQQGVLWQDLVQQMTGGTLDGRLGGVSPGEMARLVDGAGDPSGFLELMVGNLVHLLDEAEAKASYFDGLALLAAMEQVVGRIEPGNQSHAVHMLLPRAVSPRPLRARLPDIVAPDLLVEGVESLLQSRSQVPTRARERVEEIAASAEHPSAPCSDLSAETVARAQELRERLLGGSEVPGTTPYYQQPALRRLLAANQHGTDLADQLDDHALRRRLEMVLGDAYLIGAGTQQGGRAGASLHDRYLQRLELGEFKQATDVAHVLLAREDGIERNRLVGEEGVEVLLDAMTVWGKQNRHEVAQIVQLLGERLVPALLRRLEVEEGLSRRRRLLEMTIAVGAPALPHLRRLLDDDRWFVVRNAIFVLRRLGDPTLPTRLEAMMGHTEPKVVSEVIKSYATTGDRRWLEALRGLLDRKDPAARKEALALAARIPHPDLGRMLLRRLSETRGVKLKNDETIDLIEALGGFEIPGVMDEYLRLATLSKWKHPFRLTLIWESVARAAAKRDGAGPERVLEEIAAQKDPAADLARDLLRRRRGGAG